METINKNINHEIGKEVKLYLCDYLSRKSERKIRKENRNTQENKNTSVPKDRESRIVNASEFWILAQCNEHKITY